MSFLDDFYQKAYKAALAADHVYPGMAAAEAALESDWGRSELCVKGSNLFGTKQHQHPIYGTFALPTKEFLHHEWVTITAEWIQYPDWSAAFTDRMHTLQSLAHAYPHYAAALAAKDGLEYITEVSKSWSTDPDRARKVMQIYRAHGAGL